MAKRSNDAIKSDAIVEDSDEVDDEADYDPRAKKPKQEKKPTAPASSGSAKPQAGLQTDAEGGKYIDLGKSKRVTVRTYKKAILIDIREFYTDKSSGDEKPGKKGIALTPEAWETLKEAMPAVRRILVVRIASFRDVTQLDGEIARLRD